MTRSKPASKGAKRTSRAAKELPDDKLEKVAGGAVPFHRVINNTIYGSDTQTTIKRDG